MSPNQSKLNRQLLYVGLFVLIAAVFFYSVRGILLPFVTGIMVAYLMNPLVNKFEQWKLHRGLAAAISLMIFFGVVVMVFLLIVPVLKGQVAQFGERLPDYVHRLQLAFKPLETYLLENFSISKNNPQIQEFLSNKGGEILKGIAAFLSKLVSGGFALINLLSLIFITPIVAFYLLRDFNKFTHRLRGLIPRDYLADFKAQALAIDRTLAGFLRGQATVCLLLGTYFGIALSIVGLEFGLVIGLLCGVLVFLPYVGSMFGFLLCVGLGYVQYNGDMHQVLMIAIVYGAGQFIEGNFLTPYLVGGRVGLHPVWIIFALLAGGALAGLMGVIVAVPIAAVIGVLVRYAISNYESSEFYLAGHPPAKAKKSK
jgi:predicted PurR-regulated permease PerM